MTVRRDPSPMAVRRDPSATAWTTGQSRPAKVRTIRGWEAPTRQRRRRFAALGVLAVAVGGLLMSGFMGSPEARTTADAAGRSGPAAEVGSTAWRGSTSPAAARATTRPTPFAPNGAATSTGRQRSRFEPVAATSLEPELVLLATSTIAYDVGPENGDGDNIAIPLRRLDGLVLRPGATFDFWKAVGEVSRRAGYRPGGIIIGDHLEPQGALAGGICVVSTAMFEAAATSGLAIVARRSHTGYLSKYPLGLDAAVTKSGGGRQDLIFRNDTNEEILVRTVSTPGTARIDLYAAAPIGRRVVIGDAVVSHRRPAHDRTIRTSGLPRGQTSRIEPRSDGMTVSVERTVRDTTGRLLHRDRWTSVYRPLTGLVKVGTG